MLLVKLYFIPLNIFKLLSNTCAAKKKSSGTRRPSNVGIKIKNEQDHKTSDNEDSVINSERPHKKSRKRALEE